LETPNIAYTDDGCLRRRILASVVEKSNRWSPWWGERQRSDRRGWRGAARRFVKAKPSPSKKGS